MEQPKTVRSKISYIKLIQFFRQNPKITIYEFNQYLKTEMDITTPAGRSRAITRFVNEGLIEKKKPWLIFCKEF